LDHKAPALIDDLIACWSDWDINEDYYLTDLAPRIVRSPGSAQLNNREKEIVAALQKQLSQGEWQQLPTLIAQRRAGELKELDSDRERAKALEEAERECRQAEEARMARKRALVARLKDVGLTRFRGPIRVKRSSSMKGVEEDGQERQTVSA